MAQPYNVLFLCTGNSARSILAEAIINREGNGRFNGYSAGSTPKEEVHPYTLEMLNRMNHDTAFARSKSWDKFDLPDAPKIDFVFTLRDDAAEQCPYWPGHPMTAHWGMDDPAAATGNEAERHLAFSETYRRCDLTLTPIDPTRVFFWTCRSSGNALRRALASKVLPGPKKGMTIRSHDCPVPASFEARNSHVPHERMIGWPHTQQKRTSLVASTRTRICMSRLSSIIATVFSAPRASRQLGTGIA